MRSTLMLAAVAAAFFSTTSSSHAQNMVPGGWSSQVNYQGVGSGFGTFGQPYGNYGGYSGFYGAYGNGVVTSPYPTNAVYVVRPQTTNNLGFLGETVRRTTRSRRTR